MSFTKKLTAKVDDWQERGLLTQTQQQVLLKDIHKDSPTGGFFTILAVIGSFFIGLGALLVISSNWAYLPKLLKLLLIILMPIASLGIGYYLTYVKEDFKKIGDSFIVLGSLLIGASIALYGQLYHIDGSVGNLLLMWCILSLPLTFYFRFRVLAAISVSLFYLMLAFYSEQLFNLWDEPRNVLMFFTLLSAILMLGSYAVRQTIAKTYKNILYVFEIASVKVFLFMLFVSLLHEEAHFFGESLVSSLFQHALFLAAVFAFIWIANKKYNDSLRNTAFLWLGAFMILKYFDWFWSYMQMGVSFVLFGIFLLALVYAYIKITRKLAKKA